MIEWLQNYSGVRSSGINAERDELNALRKEMAKYKQKYPDKNSEKDESEDEDHRAAGIGIEVGHFIEVLFWTEFVEEDVEDIYAALDDVVVLSSDDFLALLSEPDEVLFEEGFHLLNDVDDVGRNCVFFLAVFFEGDRPGFDDGLPAQMNRLHVDHAASWDCGWGGDC